MITYIKLNVKTHYVNFEEPLDSNLFNIGSSWKDFMDNKWVLLSDELLAFHNENPNASVKEVFNMLLTPAPVRTLDEVKSRKRDEITRYDSSDEVNSFYLNNNQVWLDKSTRVGLMNSLNIEKTSGKELSILWLNNNKIIVNIDAAILMLSALELYALECYNTTANHINAITNLTLISEVEDYDYTTGYPDKLEFNIA